MSVEERAELDGLRAMRAELERLWAMHDGALGVWTRRDILRSALAAGERREAAR